MDTEANIKEIFSSIQGEGPVIGYKQLFIRFCGCNLTCKYCDTDFDLKNSYKYSPASLLEKICEDYDISKFHSISLTGGEPLLNTDFLKIFLQSLKEKTALKIYLETNATLYNELLEIKDYIDIISADIKLPSCTGKNTFELHEKFLKNCNGIYTFAKIVFNEDITEDEIKICTTLAQTNNIELILQPEMDDKSMCVNSEFCVKTLNRFLTYYQNIRLIPQMHKFMQIQ